MENPFILQAVAIKKEKVLTILGKILALLTRQSKFKYDTFFLNFSNHHREKAAVLLISEEHTCVYVINSRKIAHFKILVTKKFHISTNQPQKKSKFNRFSAK